jgi:CO/xanthine dehydrogenase Mo-binding subunit
MGLTWQTILASVVATVLAISVERVRTKYVDDDFLMLVVPLVGMAAVLYLTASFPS